ncbi:MAG TPA: hypothetical protein VMF05_06005 [Stellaceae bacterium]|nr:hypothetical protein [Stellaceae bacterium]
MTANTARNPRHPAPAPHASGRGPGVARPDANGGISSPLAPPQRPGASVPMDQHALGPATSRPNAPMPEVGR